MFVSKRIYNLGLRGLEKRIYLQWPTMKTSYKVQCGIDQKIMEMLMGSCWLLYQDSLFYLLPIQSLRVLATDFSANCQLINLTKKYVRKILLFLDCLNHFFFQISYTILYFSIQQCILSYKQFSCKINQLQTNFLHVLNNSSSCQAKDVAAFWLKQCPDNQCSGIY